MSLNTGIDQNGWYEQIAAEFIKYECLSYPGPPNEKILGDINKAYTEIAKTFSLTDIQAVKKEISNMKDYVNKMMRNCVRLSIMNGGGGQDALNYAPPWFKLLEPRLKVLKLACKMEMLRTLKLYNTGKRLWRVTHFTSEIVSFACRAAARELARDCTNEGASKPSKDSLNGGGCGLAGDNGEVSKLAEDSTNGEVSALGSHNTNGEGSNLDSGNTNGGVSDSAIESTDRAARAAITLVSEDAVREYAENFDIPVNHLHSIWVRIYAQSICKLMSLIAAGDRASEKYAPIVWLAADAGLLYDTRLTVVSDKTFQSSVTLHPLILLFKLMVAAHEKMKEIKTLPNLMAKNIIGAQTGTPENSNINIPSSSDKRIPDKDTSERNSVVEMRVDGNKSNEFETKSARDIYERERSRHIWALVHINYILSGRSCSAVLLQRRWHEMKQKTRQLLAGKDAPLAPSPILLALAKQFPSVLTEKLPPWSELVLDNLIYQDSQLEPYRRLYAGMRLEVPNQIGENLILDDLYDWSDDEVEVIDENRETIIVPDSDDEETDKGTNEQTDTCVNNTTIDNNTSELNDEYDSIKKLESIDPNKAKVQIIFENESDDDSNDFINRLNDPGASKNTISNITNVIEGLNLTRKEIIYESDENDSDQNILNTDNKLLDITQTSKIIDIILNNEYNKTNVRNSVSNEIETQVRPDNHNQNVGIDMDEEISDLRNKLIRASSNVSKKDTQTEDTDAADEMCDDEDKPSSDDKGERPDPLLVDKKLVQLSHVVLTPIEDLPEWRKYSRNNIINCRQFSVKIFTKKVYVTSKQLETCRPYISKKSTNGIRFRKNQELRQIPKDFRNKINILSKRLNLSRTYFSQEFWSERNLELVELCRPFSIQLKRIPRVIKKIELADIDDVRRINRTILTAQVAPITVEANRVFIIDSSVPSTTSKRIQERSEHNSTDVESQLIKYAIQKTNLPSNLTVGQENEKISDSVAEENLLTPNLPEDNTTKSLDSDLEKDELPTEPDIQEMIKTIVRKGDLPKASDTAYILETQDNDYFSKQKDLEKDLRQISKAVLKQYFNRTENETPNKRKYKKRVKKQPNPIPNENTLDSQEDWKIQKQQNLVYWKFITNRGANEKLDKLMNKKKKDKQDRSNAKVNLHKGNEGSQSKDTSEMSVSSDYSEKVIKRTSCELVCEAAVKNPRLEINDKAISDVIEVSDDSSDRNIKIISNDMSNNINTESPNNQNQSLININIIKNTIQINEYGSNEQQNNEKSTTSSIISSLPESPSQMPVIQSVTSLSQLSHLSLNQMPPDVIDLNQASLNQVPVIQSVSSLSQLSHQSLNQMPSDVIDLHQASLNQMPVIQSVSSLSQLSHQSLNHMPPDVSDLNQASLNQMPVIQSVSSLSQLSHQLEIEFQHHFQSGSDRIPINPAELDLFRPD